MVWGAEYWILFFPFNNKPTRLIVPVYLQSRRSNPRRNLSLLKRAGCLVHLPFKRINDSLLFLLWCQICLPFCMLEALQQLIVNLICLWRLGMSFSFSCRVVNVYGTVVLSSDSPAAPAAVYHSFIPPLFFIRSHLFDCLYLLFLLFSTANFTRHSFLALTRFA